MKWPLKSPIAKAIQRKKKKRKKKEKDGQRNTNKRKKTPAVKKEEKISEGSTRFFFVMFFVMFFSFLGKQNNLLRWFVDHTGHGEILHCIILFKTQRKEGATR